MTVLDVISRTLSACTPGEDEDVYQAAIQNALTNAGFPPQADRIIPDLGQVDFFIPGNPSFLIELKASSDWRNVAEGLAQLRIYGSAELKRAKKILALPEPLKQHPEVFREMAADLGIEILTP